MWLTPYLDIAHTRGRESNQKSCPKKTLESQRFATKFTKELAQKRGEAKYRKTAKKMAQKIHKIKIFMQKTAQKQKNIRILMEKLAKEEKHANILIKV